MEVAAEPLPSVEVDPQIKIEPEEKTVLTPPASVDADKQDGGTDQASAPANEEEEEDIGDIVPDHYYGGGEIPVFKPTMKEFKSFPKFIRKIDKYGMQSGIVKVIPPKEWIDSLPQLDDAVKTIKVKNPITQEFHGQHGVFTQANMEKQRSYNLPQWKALTEESNHQPPAKRGERRRNQEKEAMRSASMRAAKPSAPPTPTSAQKRGRGRVTRARAGAAAAAAAAKSDEAPENDTSPADVERPLTPASPIEKSETPRKVEKPANSKKTPEKTSRAKTGGPKSVSSRRTHNPAAQSDEVDEEAFKSFDYRLHDGEEWTSERCQELEYQYWRSLNFSNPMYGADMPGSLFNDSVTSWNVAKLENLLDVLGTKVPGVNTAYLYLGMWRATFAWHLEDVDLYSINYIHFGAPKQWYSISQRDARKFERAMKTIWSSDAKNCDQFLRHKTYLVSPHILKTQYGVEVNRLVHYEGEFVITFPYGYHSGYNLGYNCAESVNFATEAWLEYGKIAKKCNCEADSVWVDVYDIERKLRGEPTPEYEYYEEDEDEEIADLPTPPASDKDQVRSSKKRKLNTAPEKEKAKRLRLTVKSPPKPVCTLCPNDYTYEPLLRTEEGNMAHRICALYVPETYVTGPDGQEVVAGVRNIDKKRLELKCLACRSKHGAVFQCSHKKCARAYHATCAGPAGVSVEIGMTSFYGEDGTEYQDVGIDFRCRFHRPKRPKYADENTCVEALEKNLELQKYAQALQKGDSVQFQYFNGDIRAGYVVENRESEQTVLVYSTPFKTHIEVEHKFVLYFDKANQQLKPPSKDALPMPAHLAHKSSTSQEDPTTDAPKMDEPFHDPSSIHKWAEFNSAKIPRNIDQAKVEFDKANTTWFYLGKTSTEARAQYTHDPNVPTHNPASNYLDTIAPASELQSRKISVTSGLPKQPAGNAITRPVTFHAGHPLDGSAPPTKRPRGRPLGSKKKDPGVSQPWLQKTMIDPTALRNQQAFMMASTGHPGIGKPSAPYARPTAAHLPGAISGLIEGTRALPPALAPAHYSAHPNVAGVHTSPTTEATNFSRTSANSHTPPSTTSFHFEVDEQDAELLKKLAPYPYLLRCAKNRPAVYQSPYGPPGIINEPYLPLPREAPVNHRRHTSLSQDFLSSRSPSQLETVQGHVRTVSTEKAKFMLQEAERRQRENLERQCAAQSLLSKSEQDSDWLVNSTAATPPLDTQRRSDHAQPESKRYPPTNFRPMQSLHMPTASAMTRGQQLQSLSPRNLKTQLARDAVAGESGTLPHFDPALAAHPSIEEEPSGLRLQTPPASNVGSTDGTSGSPLRAGRDGVGGETLPVMQGYHD